MINLIVKIKNNRGYTTLLSVIILVAIGASVVTSMILLGTANTGSSLKNQQSNIAKGYANACVEDALLRIQQNVAYSGVQNLSFSNGSCTSTVTGTAPNKSITVTATVDTVVRKLQITINQTSPNLNVSQWAETQ